MYFCSTMNTLYMYIGYIWHQFATNPNCAQEDLKENDVPVISAANPSVLMNTRQSCLSSTKIFLHLMPTAWDSQSCPACTSSISDCYLWFLCMSPCYSRYYELVATYLSIQGYNQRHFSISIWINMLHGSRRSITIVIARVQ